MAVIHVLDPHTAELIAAGEVVERPASVVKELTENAIDAGADAVTISIERGGTAMIQIADNGSGIEAESIPTAFIRHATSKIEREEDLQSIHTLGFRGEALASVASVARVELLTKTEADEYACLYRIHGGAEQGIEPAARPVGTTITVRDLFYNTPARMKFLKKDTTEGNYAADVVTQLALSHPEISFKLVRDGRLQFQTPGDGNLLAAAYAALSRDFAKELVTVENTAGCYTVYGLITPPSRSRASRSMQFFFINGRYVKNRTMMAALEAAYKGTLMQGKFPGCILFLKMPPQLVDVNVHPAKTEVRFAREKEVFEAVYQSVKGVLIAPQNTERAFSFEAEQGNPAAQQKATEISAAQGTDCRAPVPNAAFAPGQELPAVARPAEEASSRRSDFGVRAVPAARQSAGEPICFGTGFSSETLASAPATPYRTREKLDIWPEDEPDGLKCPAQGNAAQEGPAQIFAAGQKRAAAAVQSQEPAAGQKEDTAAGREEQAAEQPQQTPSGTEPALGQTVLASFAAETTHGSMRLIGEVFDTYIVAQRAEDLCLLDKHAAHERILYEKLVNARENGGSQMLLTPVTVQLSAEEKDAVLQSEAALQQTGLEIEDFGGGAVVVRAVPADVEPADTEDLVVELASRLAANPRETASEKTEWVLHSVACRAAIKAGDKTHAAELMRLAEDVLDGKIPPFCPHGRPIVLKIPKKELEKQFGRQG